MSPTIGGRSCRWRGHRRTSTMTIELDADLHDGIARTDHLSLRSSMTSQGRLLSGIPHLLENESSAPHLLFAHFALANRASFLHVAILDDEPRAATLTFSTVALANKMRILASAIALAIRAHALLLPSCSRVGLLWQWGRADRRQSGTNTATPPSPIKRTCFAPYLTSISISRGRSSIFTFRSNPHSQVHPQPIPTFDCHDALASRFCDCSFARHSCHRGCKCCWQR